MSTSRISSKNKKTAAPLPPAIKSTPFAQVADRLDDTAILLHGLHRRHKNQHRVSTYWWPAFGQLRRAVSRLLEDVRKSEEEKNAAKNAATKTIVARVDETRALVPKVYLAFSRLVADKQFAPLGLLLVGVLAQVQAAVKDIEGVLGIADAGDDAADGKASKAPPSSATTTSISISKSASTSATKSSFKKAPGGQPDVDFGVAIARDSGVDASGKPAKSASSSSSGKLKKRARRDDDSEEDVLKLAAAAAPASASNTSETKSATTSGPKPRPEKKRKTTQDERRVGDDEGPVETATARKAPAVGGDELGQERREKKQPREKKEKKEKKESKDKDKKKKRKRGDEFDDLFSGLL